MKENERVDETVTGADYKLLTPTWTPIGAFPKPPKAKTSPDAAPGPWKKMPPVPRLAPSVRPAPKRA